MFKNTSNAPLFAKQYSHFRPHSVLLTDIKNLSASSSNSLLCSANPIDSSQCDARQELALTPEDLCSLISINKTIMSLSQIKTLNSIIVDNCNVFNNDLSCGYNHHTGRFYADFSFVNKPPPTRVFVPQFKKDVLIFNKQSVMSLRNKVCLSTQNYTTSQLSMFLRHGSNRRAELDTSSFRSAHLMS